MYFLKEAIKEAKKGVLNKEGGPFGAVVVKDGKIVGRGHNQVVLLNDPTAHAEIQAIRDACKNLNTFSLEGCELYTTCEPCPMCFSAIHWTRISKVYYSATRKEASEIGFDDGILWKIVKGEEKDNIEFIRIKDEDVIKVMKLWQEIPDKIIY